MLKYLVLFALLALPAHAAPIRFIESGAFDLAEANDDLTLQPIAWAAPGAGSWGIYRTFDPGQTALNAEYGSLDPKILDVWGPFREFGFAYDDGVQRVVVGRRSRLLLRPPELPGTA
jgi:hypothetical protein